MESEKVLTSKRRQAMINILQYYLIEAEIRELEYNDLAEILEVGTVGYNAMSDDDLINMYNKIIMGQNG